MFVAFLVSLCTTAASFIAQISSTENVSKPDAILAPVAKRVNSQGYSELREPIQTHKNCYSLIWKILKSIILKCVQNARN